MREDNNSRTGFSDAENMTCSPSLGDSTTGEKTKNTLLSSHSGTLVLSGLIVIGFIIAWLFGGFPSILLPSFIILAIGIPVDLLSTILKPTPKEKSKPVKPIKAVFFLIVFFLIFAWFGGAGLSIIENPGIADKIFKKVEFPFSEASHVVADSEGSVYVFSQFSCRVQKYNKKGRFQFGWFSGGWKTIEMAIDENDFIYTYADGRVIRQYDRNGNMTQKISRSERYGGWWRLKDNLVVWGPDAEKHERSDQYNEAVRNGELLPSTKLRKTGFKTADAEYYKLTRLWFLFPVVSVEKNLSEFEGYIMPNPLSLAFTFVFPGFLFYILALIGVWVLEKQAERFTKRGLAYILVTMAIFVVAVAMIIIGGSIVISIANSLSKDNPLHFWLVPIVLIPYWCIVGFCGMYLWRATARRFLGPSSTSDKKEQ